VGALGPRAFSDSWGRPLSCIQRRLCLIGFICWACLCLPSARPRNPLLLLPHLTTPRSTHALMVPLALHSTPCLFHASCLQLRPVRPAAAGDRHGLTGDGSLQGPTQLGACAGARNKGQGARHHTIGCAAGMSPGTAAFTRSNIVSELQVRTAMHRDSSAFTHKTPCQNCSLQSHEPHIRPSGSALPGLYTCLAQLWYKHLNAL